MGDGNVYDGLDSDRTFTALFTKYQTNSPIKHFATNSTHIIVIHPEVNI